MNPVVFDRAQGGRVEIGEIAWQALIAHRQLFPADHESGGVLLGRYLLDSDDIVIDAVTTHRKHDRRSRHRFHRAKQPHQQLINEAWTASSGTTTYLGEWHTHPQRLPRPSSTDLSDWSRKLVHDEFTDSLFFVIVGTRQICIWEGERCSRSQTLLGGVML